MTETLAAAADRVVRFHYLLRDAAGGDILESSRDAGPAAALLGHANLMPGLEAAFAGRMAGERFDVELAPAEAFGERREDWTQRLSKKHFAHPKRLRPGMRANVQGEAGPRTVTVLKVGSSVVDVDLNHPLAGRTVVFEIELLEVREATPEERAHGHAHGTGGHQH